MAAVAIDVLAPFALVGVIAIACTAAPSTSAPTSTLAATQAPTVAAPTVAPATDVAPTIAPPTSPDGQPTFSIPSFALPSFAADSELAARFPTQIDGQPVTDVTTVLFMEFLLAFAPEQADEFRNTMSQVGIDANTMSFGTASTTVDGETVQVEALRTAGTDASTLVANFAAIGAALDPDEEQPTLTQVSIGGKNVTKATDADGDASYLYASGDILWFISDVDETQAATILAALP